MKLNEETLSGDLISRDALKSEFDKHCVGQCNECHYCGEGGDCTLINNASTLEPEITEKQAIAKLINSGWLVKHDKELRDIWKRPEGKWVASCGEHYCSNCENVALSSDFGEILTDFCPYCGASML